MTIAQLIAAAPSPDDFHLPEGSVIRILLGVAGILILLGLLFIVRKVLLFVFNVVLILIGVLLVIAAILMIRPSPMPLLERIEGPTVTTDHSGQDDGSRRDQQEEGEEGE